LAIAGCNREVMMKLDTVLLLCTLSTGALAAVPAPAAAQQHVYDIARAQELEQRAHGHFSEPHNYAQAARMMRESARLRSPADLRALDNLQLAARLFHHAGRIDDARATFHECALRATAIGEVEKAAHAYLDAALAAIQEGNAEALDYMLAAQSLAISTHLTDKERAAILSRVAPVRVAADSPRTQ
jgi:hypothetical protein